MRSAIKRRLRDVRWQFARQETPSSAAVTRAAEFLGLRATDARHRELLLVILAETLFGKATRGRKPHTLKARGRNRLEWLGLAALEYRDMSDSKAAGLLFGQYKGKGFASAEAIRRALPEARDALDRMKWEHEPPDGWNEDDDGSDDGKDE
jgi:hypothetical protein